MKIFVETPRTYLREILPSDMEGLYDLDSNPEVHRYLGNRPVTNKEQILEVIAYIRKQYEDHQIGRWAIIDKATSEFIGWAGLKFATDVINNHSHYYDLGYRLRQNYWGKGYAFECALASMKYGFQELQLQELFATAHHENVGSNRILQKIGMQNIEQFLLDGVPHNWYRIDKTTFENNQKAITG